MTTPSWPGQTSAPDPAAPATPSRGRRGLGCLLEIVETLVLTVVLFWVIQSFVAQPFQVRQHSMEHTIEDSQFVLVDRLTPHFDAYHRGDIIVFTPPPNAETGGGEPFIKRVIGVAGDTVALQGGQVFVNGVALDEPYLYAEDNVPQPTLQDGPDDSWTIEPGMLFVMGDHRERSSDSRVFGPIQVSSVIGRAWLRYWPINTIEILPTAKHPELAGASPGASVAPSASPKPSAKPAKTHKPSRTPKP
ncbi:MAG TPA: signal peptidase I [Candidatus Limnocylindrales bacterium]|nr:signal peptidase I [Candidatus Limnocylindrales bacterium]